MKVAPARKLALVLLAALFASPSDAIAQGPRVDAAGDSLPAQALQRFGTVRFRHGSRIQCLAMSQDGRRIAAGGGNDPVRIWDAETGQELKQFPETWIQAAVFTKYGGQLLTGGALKVVRIWNLATGKEDAQLTGHQDEISALAISSDNILLASASDDGVIMLWETGLGKITSKIAEFKGHTDRVTSLAFSPDADSIYLVSSSADRTVRVWSTVHKKMLHQLDGGGAVAGVTFIDDKTVAAAGDDKRIRVWSAETGAKLGEMTGHEGGVVGLAAARGNGTLVSSGDDGTLRIWDAAARKQLSSIPRHSGDGEAVALSKDGLVAACGGGNHTVRVFDTKTGKERTPGLGMQAGLAQLALAPDGNSVVTITSAGTITVWDRAKAVKLRSWESGHQGEIVMAYAHDGSVLASGDLRGAVRFWDPQTGKELFQLPGKQDDKLLSVVFSPKESLVALGYRSGAVDVWDWKLKAIAQAIKLAAPGRVEAVAFSTDGGVLAIGGMDKVALWSMAQAKQLRMVTTKEGGPPAPTPNVASLAFASDGKTLAIGCYDGAIRLVDYGTAKEIRTLDGHGSVPFALAFSADGRILASGSFDKTVRLWEAFSGLTIASFAGHQGPVHGVALAPDGRSAFSASADTSALAWDVTGQVGAGNPPNVAADFDSAWRSLASDNMTEAHRTMWAFVAQHQDGIPLIAKQLYLIDPMRIDQLFKDLNAEKFDVRNKATKELERYGRWMEGRFRAALSKPPTLEVQRRLEQMLSKLTGGLTLEQERIRARRVMLILEQVKSPAARQVMQSLIDGAPEVDLQAEARVSMVRMAGK